MFVLFLNYINHDLIIAKLIYSYKKVIRSVSITHKVILKQNWKALSFFKMRDCIITTHFNNSLQHVLEWVTVRPKSKKANANHLMGFLIINIVLERTGLPLKIMENA